MRILALPSKRQKCRFLFNFIKVIGLIVFVAVTAGLMVAVSHRKLQQDISKLHEAKGGKLRGKQGAVHNRHHIKKRNAGNFVDAEPTFSSGVAYVRWGRMDCAGGSQLVYPGFAAATRFDLTGGGSNYLCVYNNITYRSGRYLSGFQDTSYLAGVEWIFGDYLFDYSEVNSNSMSRKSLSCAVCLAKARSTHIMIPGKGDCPSGWSFEYGGFIMAGSHGDKHASEFICVDRTPQAVFGSEGVQEGARLHMVEAQCPYSLPCGPVVTQREFECVVCTI